MGYRELLGVANIIVLVHRLVATAHRQVALGSLLNEIIGGMA